MVYQDMMGSSCSQGDLGQTWGKKKKKRRAERHWNRLLRVGLESPAPKILK